MPVTAEPNERPPAAPTERALEDKQLFKHYLETRDPAARDALVERFLPLARQLARRYQRAEESCSSLMIQRLGDPSIKSTNGVICSSGRFGIDLTQRLSKRRNKRCNRMAIFCVEPHVQKGLAAVSLCQRNK